MTGVAVRGLAIKYAGVHLRSRAELRWAMFFDLLRIEWEYEKCSYRIGGDFYLPDFYLPGLHAFVEIKGNIEQNNIWKVQMFQQQMEMICPVHVFIMGPEKAEIGHLESLFPGDVRGALKFINGNYSKVVDSLLDGRDPNWTKLPCGHFNQPEFERYSKRWEELGYFWFKWCCLDCNVVLEILQEDWMCS